MRTFQFLFCVNFLCLSIVEMWRHKVYIKVIGFACIVMRTSKLQTLVLSSDLVTAGFHAIRAIVAMPVLYSL